MTLFKLPKPFQYGGTQQPTVQHGGTQKPTVQHGGTQKPTVQHGGTYVHSALSARPAFIKMAPISCSVPDCSYVTPEDEGFTMDQMISLLTIHTNCVHLIHRPAAPAVVVKLYDIVQQPDEPVSVHSESNTVGTNSRQLFEIETDRNSEESVDSITAASLHCSDASLPTSAADLAPIVADMRTEGPVTFFPLPHHVHDGKLLHPLNVGDHVLIQDQHGYNPKQWTTTGVMTEVGPYYSYLVSGSRQSSEAHQSSSYPDTSSTPPPAEIIPPPRPPEPDLPAVTRPASPLQLNNQSFYLHLNTLMT